MNGSPAGGNFRGLQMTGSGTGPGGNQPTEGSNPPPSWMAQEIPGVLRPGFYPRLDTSFYATDPARILQSQLSTTTSTGSGAAPLVPTLPPAFHHHPHHHHQHPSPLLPPYHLYSPLSPGGYAHAAAAAALSTGRPPYLDPAFLAGSLPRYRYLLPGTSTAAGGAPSRFGQAPSLPQVSPTSSLPSPAGKIDPMNRSLSESENLARWRRPGSSPKPPSSASNPVLPLIPERSVMGRPRLPVSTETPHPFLSSSDPRAQSSSGPSLPTQPYYPSHFMRGTVIQLASGELKRVEDLNTEDFVRSANLSNELKMDSSTVVKIEEKSKDTVLLCFSVGEHKVQVSVEATVEHPFFVIGQGWSSCSPERTRTLYGLPCQRLQVGDICISLTHRDISGKAHPGSSTHSAKTVTMVMSSSGGTTERAAPPSRKRSIQRVGGERSSVPLDTQRRKERGRRWSCSY